MYADIDIADDWLESALTDDEELVAYYHSLNAWIKVIRSKIMLAVSLQQSEHMHTSENSDPKYAGVQQNSGSLSNVSAQSSNAITSNSSGPVSHHTNVLVEYARQHGLTVYEVPHDGNYLFSSIAHQLQNVGHDVNANSLRQIVVSYLRDHGGFYGHFVHSSSKQ